MENQTFKTDSQHIDRTKSNLNEGAKTWCLNQSDNLESNQANSIHPEEVQDLVEKTILQYYSNHFSDSS